MRDSHLGEGSYGKTETMINSLAPATLTATVKSATIMGKGDGR